MALHICDCSALSNHHHPIPPFFSSPSSSSCSSSPKPSSSSKKPMPRAACLLLQRRAESHPPNYLSRRSLGLSVVAIFLNGCLPNLQNAIPAQQLELQRYTDSDQGFTLLRPSSWLKVDKAGATVLFEEPNNGSNNVGVVVNPVRLTTLGEFGSPQFVADKLIQAERRKESTKDVVVIGYAERPGQGSLQVYEFEYEVDSTRGGMKRIFSAAFVASKKLYLALNKEPQDDRDPSQICDVAFNYLNVVTGYNSTVQYVEIEKVCLFLSRILPCRFLSQIQ
ncbi:hypothetical protein ACFX13_000162 [Malus domestica]